MAVNNVVLVGRLTNDPVVNTIGEENKVKQAKFTLAVDRPYKKQGEDRPEADFIKINAKRGSAEFAERYFNKGKQVSVVGSIRTYSFQKDGQTVYDFCIEAEKLGFADSASGGTNGQNNSSANNNQGGFDVPDGFGFAPQEDDLPFGMR